MEASSNSMKQPVMANIRAEWDWVKEGVEEIKSISPRVTWRPEDVYASCLSGESALWTSERDWFAVTTIKTDPFNGERSLFGWLMWSRRRGENIAHFISSFLESIARQSGCVSVEAETTEDRLVEYYKTIGYESDHVTVRKQL
jgi:hypothetical protein